MYKMLIVDDESRIRRGIRNCTNWESIGISVVGEASNGREAIKLVVEFQPDIIITDIRMPDIDGLEFIKTIRDLDIHNIVIIISGYDDFGFAQQAIRYSVKDYVLKPINEVDLIDRITSCIQELEAKKKGRNNQNPIKSVSDSKANMLVDIAIDYINTNFSKEISLQNIANHLFIHPNYFSSLFKEITGETYLRYLTKLRMDKAKELMKNSQLKVYEIAEMVGYKDYRRFSKLFKFYVGETALNYRMNIFKIY